MNNFEKATAIISEATQRIKDKRIGVTTADTIMIVLIVNKICGLISLSWGWVCFWLVMIYLYNIAALCFECYKVYVERYG